MWCVLKMPFIKISRLIESLTNRFFCPCCQEYSPEFLPFGIKPRKNAQCPRCGSLERHRLLWLYLQARTDFFKSNLRILDVAPQRFLQKQWKVLKNLNYISADLSSPLAAIRVDLTDASFKDNQFDVILFVTTCWSIFPMISGLCASCFVF